MTAGISGEFVAFFLLSLVTLGGAVFMLSLTRVVHMVVALAFTFLGLAGLYVMLEAEFVAFSQVLIYAGAVSILMLFGIMLTRHDVDEEEIDRRRRHRALAFVAVLALFAALFKGIVALVPAGEGQLAKANTLEIGKALFTKYVIPFELVSVLLLVALVGAIVLARKEEDDA